MSKVVLMEMVPSEKVIDLEYPVYLYSQDDFLKVYTMVEKDSYIKVTRDFAEHSIHRGFYYGLTQSDIDYRLSQEDIFREALNEAITEFSRKL